ncbi:hypothetical protein BGZ95_010891 [Linnemannia exigua]|uniref:Uncharacterized protein n=1 Tax=Linnemannia exigua TaxID=604196 RepID=A0AAD4DK73_9FUNG|nr:hypothetical protein BGZ95_010891 [Linnemannia exigua]
MVQSLIGLDFTKCPRESPQDAQPPTSDSATVDLTPKGDEEGAEDEIKQEKRDLSLLVTFASDNINKASDSVNAPSSKEEPGVDLLGIGAPTLEPPKEDSALAFLATVATTEETTKGDVLIDLFVASNTTQEQIKRDSDFVELTVTNSIEVPHKGDTTFDLFGAGSANQESSQSKGDLAVDISRARSPAKTSSSSGFLDDLGSPYAWLNLIASRNMRQSEESRATQQEQWNTLMAKQEEDSNRIQDFIQKATTTSTIDSASSTSASSKGGSKPKMPFSLTMDIETKDHGRQVLCVNERDNLKDMVERFCVQYDMQSYEMALWVTMAKAIKKRKKQQRESNIQQQQQR